MFAMFQIVMKAKTPKGPKGICKMLKVALEHEDRNAETEFKISKLLHQMKKIFCDYQNHTTPSPKVMDKLCDLIVKMLLLPLMVLTIHTLDFEHGGSFRMCQLPPGNTTRGLSQVLIVGTAL